MRRYKNRCDTPDIHEILKKEVYNQSVEVPYGSLGLNGKQLPGSGKVSKPIVYKDTYLYLDSITVPDSISRASGSITFNIAALNNNAPVDGILAVQPSEFYFPKIPTYPAGDPNFLFFRKVYVRLSSFPQVQSVRAQNAFWYHFEFDVEDINAIAVKLVPTQETTTFFVKNPLLSLSELTMVFYVPDPQTRLFKPIPIPSDVVTIRGVPGTNPGRFTIGDPTQITSITSVLGPIAAPIAPGIAVWITLNNTTGVPAQDTIISNPNGNFITNIGFDGVNYYFEIAVVNLAAAGPFTATMVIGKNRFAMQMRFTCVVNDTTNYISIGHD